MASNLDNFVSVTITQETAGISQAGFGTPLILSPNADGGGLSRVKFYESASELIDDGFSLTSPEYLAAVQVFSQNPRPPQIAVGRMANKPTQTWRVDVATVANTRDYGMRVDGEDVGYTSDANATNDEIVAGLKAAIDALGKPVTVTTPGGVGTTYLVITANVAGAFVPVLIDHNDAGLKLSQTTADPGVAADLANFANESDSWYAVINLFQSSAMITAIAAWVEANEKLFVCESADTAILRDAYGGAGDVAKALRVASYLRTALIWHPFAEQFAGAAWLGKCLPFEPGSETWAFKTLAGVDVYTTTATHRTNAEAKSTTLYLSIGGKSLTNAGWVAAGTDYVDLVRGRDCLKARQAEGVFGVLAAANKVPYTDKGVAMIESEIRATLRRAIDSGLIAADPEFTVTAPRVASASSNDKAARVLRNVKWTATLAGAIHKVEISGTVQF